MNNTLDFHDALVYSKQSQCTKRKYIKQKYVWQDFFPTKSVKVH